MIDNFKVIISALGGAFITGIFGIWLQKTKNNSSNEGIYAEHMKDMWDRLDNVNQDLEDANNQISKLKSELKSDEDTIKELRNKLKNMKREIN